MDDELGGGPLGDEAGGVPAGVVVAVLPQGAAHVVHGEEELLGGPVAHGAEDAVVADECLEFAAEGLALDPVCESKREGWC